MVSRFPRKSIFQFTCTSFRNNISFFIKKRRKYTFTIVLSQRKLHLNKSRFKQSKKRFVEIRDVNRIISCSPVRGCVNQLLLFPVVGSKGE